MIKILHVVLSLDIGGLETFVVSLIREGSSETQSRIVCLDFLGVIGQSIGDIPIVALGKLPGMQFNCVKKIKTLVEQHDIDLIHTHNEGAHFYGALAGILSNVPVLHTRHGVHDPDNIKRFMLEWFSSLFSKKVIGVSRDIAQLYIQKFKLPRAKVATILNGIDLSVFAHKASNREQTLEHGFSSGTLLLGIVARLALVKDHKTLFAACRIVAQSHSNFRLVVIGDGPERENLVQLSRQLGLSDTILFTGARRDIVDVLNCLDIFVLSSVSEGISMTLLEAMACELPVVATRVGGNPEVVVEGVTGFLVPPQDPPALAERLLILMNNPGLRKSMGTAGRARVLSDFSLQKSVKAYLECYRQVLGVGN